MDLYCVCRGACVAGERMTECESCKQWLHKSCIAMADDTCFIARSATSRSAQRSAQLSRLNRPLYFYLHQGGYIFARLCLLACLSVCVSARLLKKLRTDLSEIFWKCQEWQKLQVIHFWG